MKVAHGIKISLFVKPEDTKDYASKLHELVPLDFEKEKITIDTTMASSFEDRKIEISEINLTKEKHIKVFLENLIPKLDAKTLEKQLETRLDSENNFFLRLDKDKLLEGKYELTDSGNCFHVKLTIAAFPKSRENAIKVVKTILQL